MGIVDVISQEIIDAWGGDIQQLLSIYESTYPPDLALKMSDVPGSFDFDIYGGDLGVAGFYINSTYESVIHLATQDLLIKILTNKNSSKLFPSFGSTNIMDIPKEGIAPAISIAVSESPYIETLNNVMIQDVVGAEDQIIVTIAATTPTGDSISVGFQI